MDAAILFADILLVLEPLGRRARVHARATARVIDRPVRSAADVARAPHVDVEEALGYVLETVRRVREGARGTVPLIGFAGAPFTLASYLIEGGPSREFLLTKALHVRQEPEAWAA